MAASPAMLEALSAIAQLEAEGQVEQAADAAEEALRRFPNARPVMLQYAVTQVCSNLDNVAEDVEVIGKVDSTIGRAIRSLESELSKGASQEASQQLSTALGLRGVLQSRVLGDLAGAIESFEQSLRHNANNIDSLYLLACIMDEALQDKERAGALYERLLAVAPDHFTGLNNYAALAVEKARAAPLGDASAIEALALAKAKLKRAQDLAPGFPAYNLACVSAALVARAASPDERDQHMQECKQWLRAAWETGGIPRLSILAEDEDLDPVRTELWFVNLARELNMAWQLEFAGVTLRLYPPAGGRSSPSFEMEGCEAAQESAPREEESAATGAEAHGMDLEGPNDGANVGAHAKPQAQGSEVAPHAFIAPGPEPPRAGTTGWTIWNSCFATLRFIESRLESEPPGAPWSADWWNGKRVLDLSAGMGLLGLACATLGARVVATDIGAKQVGTIRENAAMNGMGPEEVLCIELAWGDAAATHALLASQGPFDVVFACDIIYPAIRDGIEPALQATLQHLATASPSTQIVCCYECRQPRKEEEFMAALLASAGVKAVQMKLGSELLRDLERPGSQESDSDGEEGEGAMFAGLTLHEAPDIRFMFLGQNLEDPGAKS